MNRMFLALWSEDGQDIAEYAVMLAVILVIVVGTLRLVGSNANTVFSQVVPALAADPTNSNLYAVWSDAHHVFFSQSTDQRVTWSAAVTVNASPAVTAIFPWVAAYAGTVDVVYYGTTTSN